MEGRCDVFPFFLYKNKVLSVFPHRIEMEHKADHTTLLFFLLFPPYKGALAASWFALFVFIFLLLSGRLHAMSMGLFASWHQWAFDETKKKKRNRYGG